jgi:hypothetical protein
MTSNLGIKEKFVRKNKKKETRLKDTKDKREIKEIKKSDKIGIL